MPEKCHIFTLPALVHFYAVADTLREVAGDLGIVDQLLQRIRVPFALQQRVLVNGATHRNQGIRRVDRPWPKGAYPWFQAATKQGANGGIVREGQLRLGQVNLIPAGKERYRPAGDRWWQGRMDGTPHPRAQETLG